MTAYVPTIRPRWQYISKADLEVTLCTASYSFLLCMASEAVDWSWVNLAWNEAAPAVAELGLIVLSTPLSEELLRCVWSRTAKHIACDGAANILHRRCPDLLPELIIGDMDSAEPQVLEAYRAQGVEVQDLHEDQETNDMEKALRAAAGMGCSKLLVIGQFAGIEGRLDHTFGAMNNLYTCHSLGMQAALVTDDCCCFLLGSGEHEIQVADKGPPSHCGLVPLGAACSKISTRGLAWDMEDATLRFGGLISVSNLTKPEDGGRIWVKTSSPVLWMCERPKRSAEGK